MNFKPTGCVELNPIQTMLYWCFSNLLLITLGLSNLIEAYETRPTSIIPQYGPRKEIPMAQRLYEDLFRTYSKELRPVANDSDSINVTMQLWFMQILKVDEIDQILTIYAWVEEYWRDEFLTWDPADYGGVTTLRIPADKVWRPDILVYNNADMNIRENEISTNVVLNYTGDLVCFRANIIKITCSLDMRYFPFDMQHCNMMFASWTYDGAKVFLAPVPAQGNLDYYIENTEWKLLNFSYTQNIKYYSCCPEPFVDLTYSFVIERNPSYYTLNLIIPSILITIVTMVGFFTPYSSTGENTEKVSLGVTALLSLAIILLMVADKMPATSKVIPLIGKYYMGLIFWIFLAAIVTTGTLRLQSRGNIGKPLPPFWKHIFFDYVARALLMDVNVITWTAGHAPTANKPRAPRNNRIGSNTYGIIPTASGAPVVSTSSTTVNLAAGEIAAASEELMFLRGTRKPAPKFLNVNGDITQETSFLLSPLAQQQLLHQQELLYHQRPESDDFITARGVDPRDAPSSAYQTPATYPYRQPLLVDPDTTDDLASASEGEIDDNDIYYVDQSVQPNVGNLLDGELELSPLPVRSEAMKKITENRNSNFRMGDMGAPTGSSVDFESPNVLSPPKHGQPSQQQNLQNLANSSNRRRRYTTQPSQSIPNHIGYHVPKFFSGPTMEPISGKDRELELVLRRMRVLMNDIHLRLADEDRRAIVRKEWEILARITEQLLMYVFIIGTVTFALLMLHSTEPSKLFMTMTA